jgi:hypothetical protein
MHVPVERIILDRPRPDVTIEQRDAAAEVGRELLSAIPGVEDVSFGVALSADEPQQWYVRIRFRDEAALDVFDFGHANHLDFVEQHWAPLLVEHQSRPKMRLPATLFSSGDHVMTQLPQKPGCDRVHILIDKKSHGYG